MLKKIFYICVMVLAVSSNAMAKMPDFLKVYYTYGDFDIVYNTFQRIGLIMSNDDYKSLFYILMVLTIVAGYITAMAKGVGAVQTVPGGMIRVFGVVVVGLIIYQTFIKPTDQIMIYDETLNINKAVGGIPEGLILIAGLSNYIEKKFVDLVWAASGPNTYKGNPGGILLSVMTNVFDGGVDLRSDVDEGEYLKTSLRNYVDDCVLFEIVRPSSGLNLNSFNKTTDFMSLFEKAKNNAIYTVYHSKDNPEGKSMTCTASFDKLKTYFDALTEDSTVVTNFYKDKCGKSGLTNQFDTEEKAVYKTCRDGVTSFIKNMISVEIGSNDIVKQNIIASQLWRSFNEGDVTAVADYQTGVANSGKAAMANEWIPIIRGIVFSIFIGLVPFLCILVVTPLYSKAIAFTVGSFAFIFSWGVCDALIHSYAIEKALAILSELARGELGIKSIMMYQDSATKALSVFGAARWSGMMIAGVLSTFLGLFSGSAIAHFGSQMSQSSQHGANVGQSMGNPETKSQKMSSLEGSVPSQAVSNKYGYSGMSNASMHNRAVAVEGSLGRIGEFGGSEKTAWKGLMKAAHREAQSGITDTSANVGRNEKLGRETVKGMAVSNAAIDESRYDVVKGNEEVVGSGTGLSQVINGATTNKVVAKEGIGNITDSNVQSQSTKVRADKKIRDSYNGDMDRTVESLSNTTALQTAKSVGHMGVYGSIPNAWEAGVWGGLDESARLRAIGKFVDNNDMSAMEDKNYYRLQNEHSARLANSYFSQAASGKIDPGTQAAVAKFISTPEGRQIFQDEANRHNQYTDISKDQATAFMALAKDAGYTDWECYEGDTVNPKWMAKDDGSIGLSTIHRDKTAGGSEGEYYTKKTGRYIEEATDFGFVQEHQTLEGEAVSRTTNSGSVMNRNDNVMNVDSGMHSRTDASTNIIGGMVRSAYKLRGYRGEQLEQVTAETTDMLVSQFGAAKQLINNAVYLPFIKGPACLVNAADGFANDNNLTQNMIFKNPDSGKVNMDSNVERE